MMPVRFEPAALLSRVKHSTTEPLRTLFQDIRLLRPFQNIRKDKWTDGWMDNIKQYTPRQSLGGSKGCIIRFKLKQKLDIAVNISVAILENVFIAIFVAIFKSEHQK